MNALAEWLQKGLRVHVLDQPTKLAGRDFGRGTLLLRLNENPDSLNLTLRDSAERFGLDITGVDNAFVDEGANLGGPYVTWIKPPRVLMAVNEPTGTVAGHTWFLFDQVWKYPVTRVAGESLTSLVNIDNYDVIILPPGSYGDSSGFSPGFAKKLEDWARRGGTLILTAGATAWAASDSIALLPTRAKKKPVKPIPGENVEPAEAPKDQSKDAADKPDKSEKPSPDDKPSTGDKSRDKNDDKPPTESPDPVPGALLRVTTYQDHWLNFGMPAEFDLLMTGSLVLEPLKANDGRNLVTFRPQDKPSSGFCWPATLELLGRTPYAVYREVGRGHIIAFTDDPNYRAQSPLMYRMFQNAVFLSPGH